MSISPVPTPPDLSDPVAEFNAKAFAFWAAMPAFAEEANVLASEVEANATDAEQSATDAEAARLLALGYRDSSASNAQTAAASAGASEWASGTYATGVRRWSPSNQRLYSRRAPGGASPTDPASDPTNWSPVPIGLPVDVVTGTTATIRANVRTRCTNAAAVALTLPALVDGDMVEIDFENGRFDNSFDTGAQVIKGPNGTTATGVITHDEGGFLRLYFNGTNIRSAQ